MENNYLPSDFYKRMQSLLGDEFDAFLASYEKDRFAGLRYNPLKTDFESFMNALPFKVTNVPWAAEGFYYDLNERPGKHPFHEAGAYYIQEPSAMSAVAVLDPRPGDYCLDLCAAPGGKSTQIAARLNGEGLLVSNEIVPNRSLILAGNLERMGVRNALCLNESAEKLSGRFPSFFTKILVDAPCSGEGMFKKEENATGEWSLEHVNMCAKRQLGILNEAAKMLKAGGTLVYSTCTFNPLENESVISAFIMEHPEFSIEESDLEKYFSSGNPEWVRNNLDDSDWGLKSNYSSCKTGCDINSDNINSETECCVDNIFAITPANNLCHSMRLWPHKINGEGHFVVKLKKEGELITDSADKGTLNKKDEKLLAEITNFLLGEVGVKSDVLSCIIEGKVPVLFGDNIYLIPKAIGSLTGLKVQRAGLHVATVKKNRLEPTHALALALKPSEVNNVISVDENTAKKYIGGETISCDLDIKGWILVAAGPFSLSFGKATQGIIKNHYPKGLRINY